jgi:hypothetical protein
VGWGSDRREVLTFAAIVQPTSIGFRGPGSDAGAFALRESLRRHDTEAGFDSRQVGTSGLRQRCRGPVSLRSVRALGRADATAFAAMAAKAAWIEVAAEKQYLHI